MHQQTDQWWTKGIADVYTSRTLQLRWVVGNVTGRSLVVAVRIRKNLTSSPFALNRENRFTSCVVCRSGEADRHSSVGHGVGTEIFLFALQLFQFIGTTNSGLSGLLSITPFKVGVVKVFLSVSRFVRANLSVSQSEGRVGIRIDRAVRWLSSFVIHLLPKSCELRCMHWFPPAWHRWWPGIRCVQAAYLTIGSFSSCCASGCSEIHQCFQDFWRWTGWNRHPTNASVFPWKSFFDGLEDVNSLVGRNQLGIQRQSAVWRPLRSTSDCSPCWRTSIRLPSGQQQASSMSFCFWLSRLPLSRHPYRVL